MDTYSTLDNNSLILFLGWLNKVRQDAEKEDLYVGNARFYLTKAKEVNVKNPTEDKEMVRKIFKRLKY